MGQNIIYETTCASTNTMAARHLQEQALPEGTVIITDHQYRGRGQGNNIWHSMPHQNLTFSVVLYPTFLEVSQGFALNIITALALHQVLSAYIPSNLTIKWPNDIYYRKQKMSGILIENTVVKRSFKLSVVGIGVNINQEHFPMQSPTSLIRICRHTLDLNHVLTSLLTALERNYLQLRSLGIESLREVYLSKMYNIDEVHTFQDANQRFQGSIRGIDAIGRLIVERSDGVLQPYALQEVSFVV